jgi:two-component system phosphate regulon sensor histidine kinase PhoR
MMTRIRLILLALLLVVLPTAFLSLLATVSLRNREVILENRLRTNAGDVLSAVAARIDARLLDALEQVRASVGEAVARDRQVADVERVARSLKLSRPLVEQVYLFMNPWGFIYPAEVGRGAMSRPAAEEEVDLVDVLRRRVTLSDPAAGGPLFFAQGPRVFIFAALNERESLYAGYRLNLDEFHRQVEELARASSLNEFRVSVSDAWSASARAPGDATLRVGSSMGLESEYRVPDRRGGDPVVVEKKLAVPFDFVTLTAHLRNPDAIRRSQAWQVRLYGWGVVLLVVFVITGVACMVLEAVRETRKAHARGTFVAGISHDLRTPLASMRMLAESLSLGHVAEESTRQRFLETIVKECERLGQLVERVLFFVRYGQDALIFNRKELDLNAVVRQAIAAFQLRYQGGQGLTGPVPAIEFRAQGAGIHVEADETALLQVLLNLFDNAVKYSGPGLPEVRVSVSTETRRARWWRPASGWAVLAVMDRGIGMGRRDRRRVFREFYRGRGAADANVSGVGLGLAVCRHVVNAQGGWMQVESEPGKGSTFRVYLPRSGGAPAP